MASKALFRILNKNKEESFSFDNNEKGGTESLIPSLGFEGSRKDVDIENESDTSVTEDNQKGSFSRHIKYSFEYFEKEKEFTGTITLVDYEARTFIANLICKDDSISREVQFSMDELSPADCLNVVKGKRIIYIFGKKYCNGTVSNSSQLYFRSDLNWTNREIEIKKKEAEELFIMLNNDNISDND